jgi:ADP-ribose pyrophosphatase
MAASKQFKLLQANEMLRSRVFFVRKERWQGPDGSTFERDTVVHPGAVAIVPFDAKGRVLLIRQFRPATNGWLLEIPAGTLEKGEKPLGCAKRELVEEIGFAAKSWLKLGEIFTAPGFCSEKIHLFKAWDLKPAFAEQDEDEHIEPATMTMAEVKKAIRSGKIQDAKTLSALACLQALK